MLPVVSLILLAFAVSLDGFGVGVMYGFRKIRIPLLSIVIISFCSGLIIYTSMQVGVLMARVVDPAVAQYVGAIILMGIGVWAVYQIFSGKKDEEGKEETSRTPVVLESAPAGAKAIWYIELKRLGLVIQILRTPSIADVDRSGNISAYEAVLLGVALSLDAFGAGIGAAMLGFTPWLTAAVIALASGTFLGIGLQIGFRYAELRWIRKLSILPGFLLILMGIVKLF
ncbi:MULTISPECIES: sporulation membrane protein YtaF [unclassified Paenibacillus]|uniref:sporulation membrane protein YtaF n=1 Tax=unclassified Paenibacillus TaxID=185978 RepID=UPI001AE191E2|nr:MULTISPECIES: sporulation membrane protein YtaF [unclassified Paenibacillus]MBP1154630.1 putative sporulation protein YtaF [Paenibacillus sp. PvP091]MBP1169986.1 putative sporulation protein YtaF [Paenibacillus sp. PvR098]MBP2441014.1 putative sporulation protein YtaF [Paenibacillus sp. PvP052]